MSTTISPSQRYGTGAILLHWIIALLIIANIVIVFSAEDAPKAVEIYYMGLHKATGISILALTILRIFWRLGHRPPAFPPALKSWERGLAHATHMLFYLLMLVVPLTGWLMVSAVKTPAPIDYYGLFTIPLLPVAGNEMIGEITHEGHELLGFAMIGLIVLHVLGALKHQWLDKTPSLSRMWIR